MKKLKNFVTLLTLFLFMVGADALKPQNLLVQGIFFALALIISNSTNFRKEIPEIIVGIPMMCGIKTFLIPIHFQQIEFNWWNQTTAIAAVISYILIIVANYIKNKTK